MELLRTTQNLRRRLSALPWESSGLWVYNPLEYAWEPHRAYLERFGAPGKEAVLVGMNPGPWGMVQTGVPFGDVGFVRDWMGITGRVGQPGRLHPKRPVQGFSCRRGEGSGRRLWAWARDRFGAPDAFFDRFFVLNYCPLAFFDPEGRNLTPDKLPGALTPDLFRACDEALFRGVRALGAGTVLGVGNFAAARASAALKGTGVQVGKILHPSPASPAANRGWAEAAERQMREMGFKLR